MKLKNQLYRFSIVTIVTGQLLCKWNKHLITVFIMVPCMKLVILGSGEHGLAQVTFERSEITLVMCNTSQGKLSAALPHLNKETHSAEWNTNPAAAFKCKENYDGGFVLHRPFLNQMQIQSDLQFLAIHRPHGEPAFRFYTMKPGCLLQTCHESHHRHQPWHRQHLQGSLITGSTKHWLYVPSLPAQPTARSVLARLSPLRPLCSF